MKSCLTSLLLLLCCFISGTQAQTAQEVFSAYYRDWFQIEVIIFERGESPASDAESWPMDLRLSYPQNRVYFRDPQNPLEENQEVNSNAQAGSEESSVLMDKLRQTSPAGEQDVEQNVSPFTPKEKPYTFLPRENRRLNDDATRIARHHAMRVLFHQAWRQPVYPVERAPGIILRGGDKFNQHSELEGSLTFSLSRYLHIHTNLWLTQFEANVGQEVAAWPNLPLRPRPGMPLDTGSDAQTDADDLAAIADNKKSWGVDISAGGNLGNGLTLRDDNELILGSSGEGSGLNTYQSIANQPYVIKHIVAVEQKRRMRSAELHYLDHPRLGVLVRIDPYRPRFVAPN